MMDAPARPSIISKPGTIQENADLTREDAESQTKSSLPAISTGMKRSTTGLTVSSLISPPDSRRNTQEDNDAGHSLPPRQSLPSIREALHSNSDMHYSQSTQHTSSYDAAPTSAHTPNSPNSAKRLRPPEGPPREGDHQVTRPPPGNPYIANANYPSTSTVYTYDRTQPPTSSTSRTAEWIDSHRAPTSQPPPPIYQSHPAYSTPANEYVPRPAAPSTPQYSHAPPPMYHQSAPVHSSMSARAQPYYATPPHPSTWRPSEAEQDMKRLERSRPVEYGASIKRHLDEYELNNALNEISDAGKQITRFAEHYQRESHQAQRPGLVSGSIPRHNEIDDMAKYNLRIQDSLSHLRAVVQNQEAEIAQRNKEDQAKEARMFRNEESHASNDDLKGSALLSSEAKKRRGRAAPPGRCHSCNRAETPEWRRGPDGARTLCNACGLHYAKLTRKAANKTSLGSSSLRPKSLDPGSPNV